MIRQVICDKCNSIMENTGGQGDGDKQQYQYECDCGGVQFITITRGTKAHPVEKCGCDDCEKALEPAYGIPKDSWNENVKCDGEAQGFAYGEPRKKRFLIISAIGMPKEQREQIESEMNSPNCDKYVWIFDKAVTVDSVEE